MKLFQLSDRGCYSRGFPYAHGFGKLDAPMPFLHGKLRELSEEFWRLHPRKPGIYTGESGSKWGDLMMCAFAPPSTFISGRVFESLSGMRGRVLTATEFPIAEVKSKKLRGIPPPRYFAIQWEAGIEPDWRAMEVPHDDQGRPIIQPPIEHLIAKISTWNGADIFSWHGWGNNLPMLCTEKIVALAEKEEWTNCEFKPVATTP